MRVTYRRELKMKEHLDRLGVETFIPMRYEVVERDGERHRQLVPAIHNLIFVHASQERITGLKISHAECEPLRYIMRPPSVEGDRPRGILHVPDREMDNFLRVARVEDDRVLWLDCGEYLRQEGRRVLITGGPFAGVEGVIKRVKKNRHVVVQVEGVAAVAIAYVPREWLAEAESKRNKKKWL
mgnify:CR=1 FL=1